MKINKKLLILCLIIPLAALWILIFMTMVSFRRIRPVAAYLNPGIYLLNQA